MSPHFSLLLLDSLLHSRSPREILLQTTGPQSFSLVAAAELGSWKSLTLATFHHAFPHLECSDFYSLGQYSSDRFLRSKYQQAFPGGWETEPGWQWDSGRPSHIAICLGSGLQGVTDVMCPQPIFSNSLPENGILTMQAVMHAHARVCVHINGSFQVLWNDKVQSVWEKTCRHWKAFCCCCLFVSVFICRLRRSR